MRLPAPLGLLVLYACAWVLVYRARWYEPFFRTWMRWVLLLTAVVLMLVALAFFFPAVWLDKVGDWLAAPDAEPAKDRPRG